MYQNCIDTIRYYTETISFRLWTKTSAQLEILIHAIKYIFLGYSCPLKGCYFYSPHLDCASTIFFSSMLFVELVQEVILMCTPLSLSCIVL